MIKSMLGAAFLMLASILLPPGNFDEVYVGWGGIDRITPAHLKSVTLLQQGDNYTLDSKNEENPKFSVLSVRPEFDNYNQDLPNPFRGIFHYKSPAGDDRLLAFTSNTFYYDLGGAWVSGEAGYSNSPWEGWLWAEPTISRMYLCNGTDQNYKYLSGQTKPLKMQNQDTEIDVSGTVWFTYGSSSATADAAALASLAAGNYIKPTTTSDITEWAEITTIESSTLRFSSSFTGTTASSTVCVKSDDFLKSRYTAEYEGHLVLGYTLPTNEAASVSNKTGTMEVQLYSAYGVAQSFVPAENNLNSITLRIRRGSGTAGNFLIKIKESQTATTALKQVSVPVSSLSTSMQDGLYTLGFLSVTAGSTYWLTIERESATVSPVYLAYGANNYASGNMATTYNSGGFNSSWATGFATIEVFPDSGGAGFRDNYDATITSVASTTCYSDHTHIQWENDPYNSAYAPLPASTFQQNKVILRYPIEDLSSLSEVNIFSSVEVSMWQEDVTAESLSLTTDIRTWEAYRIITPNDEDKTWNNRTASLTWESPGCSGLETDYTSSESSILNEVNPAIGPANWSRPTLEVTALSKNWTKDKNNNHGVLVTLSLSPKLASAYRNIASRASGYNPGTLASKIKWICTAPTGSNEATRDLYFEVKSQSSNKNTLIYSKRFYPENFPPQNQLKISGRIVGMAKSGGYLIVAGKDPDALYFFQYTGSTDDGAGIDFVASIPGITFGSSKSIAYNPEGSGFFFYSGLGVYFQEGTATTLVSGKIRDEAKTFGNYRDPEDYYVGYADQMPQAAILPQNDTYFLAVPNNQAENSYIYSFNYSQDVWLRWTGETPTCLAVKSSGGSEPRLFLGDFNGQSKRLALSGSTRQMPTLIWHFSKGDLHKQKKLDSLILWGRADNPLQSGVVTLEVRATDTVNSKTPTVSRTVVLSENSTTDDMQEVRFDNLNTTGNEFKFTLTQSSSAGAISWRSVRYRGQVLDTK